MSLQVLRFWRIFTMATFAMIMMNLPTLFESLINVTLSGFQPNRESRQIQVRLQASRES